MKALISSYFCLLRFRANLLALLIAGLLAVINPAQTMAVNDGLPKSGYNEKTFMIDNDHAMVIIENYSPQDQPMINTYAPLPSGATPFGVVPHVEKKVFQVGFYNPYYCWDLGPPGFFTTVPPKYGSLRDEYIDIVLQEGNCAGLHLTGMARYYTWTSDTPTESQDYFQFGVGVDGYWLYTLGYVAVLNAKMPDAQKSLGNGDGDNNEQCPDCYEGNPIHSSTGNKYEQAVDYSGAGAFSLSLTRYYNSQSTISGVLGANWSHSYGASIQVVSPTVVNVIRPSQTTYIFRKTNDEWSSSADVNARLFPNGQSGWRYLTGDDSTEFYDSQGRLLSITNRAGLTQALTYDDQGRLASVTGPFGRKLTFTYDSAGRLEKFSDPAGKPFTYAYDQNNNLTSVTYPDGAIRQYVYENNSFPHALTGIIDENSTRFSTYTYDTQGRAVSSEHAGGADKITLNYAADYAVTIITDTLSNQQQTSFKTLQGLSRKTTVTNPKGYSLLLGYDGRANVTKRTDFNGHTTAYTYDSTRNLEIGRTEGRGTPQQRSIKTEWHPSLRLPTKITDPLRVTSFSYDLKGNLTQKTISSETASRTWTYRYNSRSLLIVEDGPRTDVSDVTRYTYNAEGNLALITDSLGHVTRITTYDAHGKPLIIIDPNGLKTQLTYDLRGRLTSIDVGGEITRYDYDPTGQLVKLTKPDGSFVGYAYDGAHRLTQINDERGNRIVYTLDAIGNRIKEEVSDPTDQLAKTLSRSFDVLNRLATSSGAQGQTTSYSYDGNGNIIQVTDPLARSSTKNYDALNRVSISTDPNAGKTLYAYDALDNLIRVTDPRGLITRYTYDGLGNLIKTASPDSGITQNTYDNAGNLLSTTDARLKQTSYTYDALNRVTNISFPSDAPIDLTYDNGTNAVDRLTQITDATGSTSWSYDKKGRVIGKTHTIGAVDLQVQYAYDAAGRLVQITYPSGRHIQLTYDADRVTEISLDASTLLGGIQYSPLRQVSGWTWGNGQAYQHIFDLDGRMTEYPLGTLTRTLGYDAASQIISHVDIVTANRQDFPLDHKRPQSANFASADSERFYNPDNGHLYQRFDTKDSSYITWEAARDYCKSVGGHLATPTSESENAFIFNNLGDNMMWLGATNNNGGAWTWITGEEWQYTNWEPGQPDYWGGSNQYLIVWAGHNGRWGDAPNPPNYYMYSFACEWESSQYLLYDYDNLGRLTSAISPSRNIKYSYDANGNRTEYFDDLPTSTNAIYEYSDHSNRLLSIQDATTHTYAYDKAGNTLRDAYWKYQYDDRGRMVKARSSVYGINGLGQRVKKSGSRTVLFAYDEAGHLIGEYSADGSPIQETVYLGDTPVAILTAKAQYFIYDDHLATPRVIANADDKVVWQWDSEPFGSDEPNEDPDNDGRRFVYNLRFPGQYFDNETGLHYNYLRDYDPRTGRYIESDPIGLEGGINKYLYVENNPIHLIDFYGLKANACDTAKQSNFIEKIEMGKCFGPLLDCYEGIPEGTPYNDLWPFDKAAYNHDIRMRQRKMRTGKGWEEPDFGEVIIHTQLVYDLTVGSALDMLRVPLLLPAKGLIVLQPFPIREVQK